MKEKNILKGLKMSDKIREQRLNVSLTWKCHGKVETLSSDRFVKPLLYECGKKLSYFRALEPVTEPVSAQNQR